MEKKKKKRFEIVDVTEFSIKGNGIGVLPSVNEKAAPIEVPFTMPGDKARVLVLPKKRGMHRSLLEEIIVPSADRISPRCVHFGICGGCRWQHSEYEQQLLRKESYVRHCLAPFLTPQIEFQPILPCLSPWQYRNKMEFSFSNNAAGDRFLGLIMDSSGSKVFNLTECHLSGKWFEEAVKAVRDWWKETDLDAFHPYKNTGSLRTLTLREGIRTGDRMVILTVSGNPNYPVKRHHLEKLIAFLRDAIEPVDPASNLSIFLRIQQAVKGMATNFYEMHLYGSDHIREILHIDYDKERQPLSLLFKISATAFFQPNTRQAEQIYSLALKHLEIPEESIVYDLYCGTGTLGICAAKLAKQVISIELSPEAVLDAKSNIEVNGFSNIEVVNGNVSEVLSEIKRERKFPLPHIVMVDPPRAGLGAQAIEEILSLSPVKILYISCNPATQAQDLFPFAEKGYRIKYVQPIDQFPQTVHIENIVILEKTAMDLP